MNEDELTPLKRENMAGFVMMKADLNTIPATYDPKIGKIKPEQLHKPFNDASRCIAGMGQLIALAGGSSESAMKAAATFQMISAGVEISAGFQCALFDLLRGDHELRPPGYEWGWAGMQKASVGGRDDAPRGQWAGWTAPDCRASF